MLGSLSRTVAISRDSRQFDEDGPEKLPVLNYRFCSLDFPTRYAEISAKRT